MPAACPCVWGRAPLAQVVMQAPCSLLMLMLMLLPACGGASCSRTAIPPAVHSRLGEPPDDASITKQSGMGTVPAMHACDSPTCPTPTRPGSPARELHPAGLRGRCAAVVCRAQAPHALHPTNHNLLHAGCTMQSGVDAVLALFYVLDHSGTPYPTRSRPLIADLMHLASSKLEVRPRQQPGARLRALGPQLKRARPQTASRSQALQLIVLPWLLCIQSAPLQAQTLPSLLRLCSARRC
jgi:hypothetical protein